MKKLHILLLVAIMNLQADSGEVHTSIQLLSIDNKLAYGFGGGYRYLWHEGEQLSGIGLLFDVGIAYAFLSPSEVTKYVGVGGGNTSLQIAYKPKSVPFSVRVGGGALWSAIGELSYFYGGFGLASAVFPIKGDTSIECSYKYGREKLINPDSSEHISYGAVALEYVVHY